MSDERIRPAGRGDLADILRLVHELAVYEREPDAVEATEHDFEQVLFPDHGHPSTFCHVAESDGRVVGIALWYLNFSTWTGQQGIWLEDLFVEPEQRGSGLGKALLTTLAEVCVEQGYRRLEWWVLNWNKPSIAFYESLGAVPQDEWTVYRVDGDALITLGGTR